MKNTRKIIVLGSTGSVGVQTLSVIKKHSDEFKVLAITGNKNIDLLVKQAIEFSVSYVVTADVEAYPILKDKLKDYNIEVMAGCKEIDNVAAISADIIIAAISGSSGLSSVISAVKSGNRIGLANKESLVCAGNYIKKISKKYKAEIIPIDSEHSAIYQCLKGNKRRDLESIILTASGGSFFDFSLNEMKNITPKMAIKHPNWKMGDKISIDSSTMFNKGLELIEACHLFDVKEKQIDVIVHRESIIHSAVQYKDGCVIAQLSMPSMEIPIAYALNYGKSRLANICEKLDFTKIKNLTFSKNRDDVFSSIQIARECSYSDGKSCVYNFANEIAVKLFIEKRINFIEISYFVKEMLNEYEGKDVNSYNDFLEIKKLTYENIQKTLKKIYK